MSKSDFAAACNVAPSCVSNWIARGKIKPDALVGEGRNAKIKADVATKQLQETLDPNQRFGLNGISTRLDLNEPSSAPAPAGLAPKSAAAPPCAAAFINRARDAERRRSDQA